MKAKLIFISLFILSNHTFSQVAGKSFTNRISAQMVLNEATGNFLQDDEFKLLIENNPGIVFKPAIDKYGQIKSYSFHPSKTHIRSHRDTLNRVKKGELFPPFVMKSTRGNEVASDQLRGKIILMQFQLPFVKPFFDKQTIYDFNTLILEIRKTTKLEALIVTESSEQEINEQLGDSSSYIPHIIADARNFHDKYQVIQFPSFVLIDKEGKLVSHYGRNEAGRLKAAIAKIK